jgi:general stress protein YciG
VIAAVVADFPVDDGKNRAAQWLGQRGGKARAKALSPERRKEIAKKAAKRRWSSA